MIVTVRASRSVKEQYLQGIRHNPQRRSEFMDTKEKMKKVITIRFRRQVRLKEGDRYTWGVGETGRLRDGG